jgi:hypothetical protein
MPPNKRRYVLQKLLCWFRIKSVANVGTPVAASLSVEKMGIS